MNPLKFCGNQNQGVGEERIQTGNDSVVIDFKNEGEGKGIVWNILPF